MKPVSEVKAQTTSITGVELAPSGDAAGIPVPKGMEAVTWFFSGGTSATVTYYVYDDAQDGWCLTGTEAFTGNKAVGQQCAGKRMQCNITTHGGGTYKRSYQYMGA